ncbi:MAG: DUF2905 domain-containing protein [Ignavibacteria bacterium]|nr:DUF2905 domain-containing protein [Ignavibacteria bacterium]
MNINFQKVLIVIGATLLFVGIFWNWIVKIPLFKLPGDIVIDKPNLKFYFPITTMILVSLLVSLIIWLVRKL